MTKAGYRPGIISLKSVILFQLALLQLWCGILWHCFLHSFLNLHNSPDICYVLQKKLTSQQMPLQEESVGAWEGFIVVPCFGYLCRGVMLVWDSGYKNAGSSAAVKIELTYIGFKCPPNDDLHRLSLPASDEKSSVMSLPTAFLCRIWLI